MEGRVGVEGRTHPATRVARRRSWGAGIRWCYGTLPPRTRGDGGGAPVRGASFSGLSALQTIPRALAPALPTAMVPARRGASRKQALARTGVVLPATLVACF